MYLGYVSSEIVILVIIEITVNKVITASIIEVVTKDGCVFKMWVVLGSQSYVVSHMKSVIIHHNISHFLAPSWNNI